MKKLSGDYIAGFVDGEGCFALTYRRDVRHKRKGKPVYFSWKVLFAINLKGDDKDILEMIKNTLECGSVTGPNKRGMVRYQVGDNKELYEKIIPFFERHELHAKKKYDFELWKDAVEIIRRNKRSRINAEPGKDGFQKVQWDDRDVEKLMDIREAMKIYKGSSRTSKWL